MNSLCDAHNHLHDARLLTWRESLLIELPLRGIRHAVVNGTSEADWMEVQALARSHSWIHPAYGLHPWRVRERSPDWLEALSEALSSDSRASLGEVGLDRWVKGHDIGLQQQILLEQWQLAAREERVATVHCLQAWGHLVEFLRTAPRLRAFLIHSYGGPAELVPELATCGAYFSFSPYFLNPRKALQRGVFATIPLNRLLVETDAPDMAPPPESNAHPLHDPGTGAILNHPSNLTVAYQALAELRGIPVDDLAFLVEQNFLRIFGD